jgi:hypothetical protein
MSMIERKYGYINFPESGEKIENVWLNITNEEIYLEVPYSLNGNSSWPIILGVFNGLEKTTFVDVFASGGQRGGAGSYRKFVVSWMLKNKHFKSMNELKFKKIVFQEQGFKNWHREPFFINQIENSFIIPQPIRPFQLILDSFLFSWELAHYIELSRKNTSISLTSSIISNFNNELSWSLIIEHISNVKKFILFLTNNAPDLSNFFLNDDVELIFISAKLNETKFPTHIELDYNEVISKIDAIARNWFENPKLNPITDLILEKHFNSQIPPHRHFFNLAVGLEAFHEKFIIKNVALKDKEIEVRRLEIKESIKDKELKLWFNNRSKEWVKPSLKDRLFDIQESFEKVSSGIFDMSAEDFITKIKQTRDDIAHAGIYNKRFKENVELIIVTKIIEFVLRINIYSIFNLELNTNKTDMFTEANKLVKQLARINDYKIQERYES